MEDGKTIGREKGVSEQPGSIELVGNPFGIKCYKTIKSILSDLPNVPEYKAAYEELSGCNFRELISCTRIRRFSKDGQHFFIGRQTTLTPSDEGELMTLILWGGSGFDISNLRVFYRRKRNFTALTMTRDGLILDDSLEDAPNVQAYDDRVSFDLGPMSENKIMVKEGTASYEYPEASGKKDLDGEEALVEIASMYEKLLRGL